MKIKTALKLAGALTALAMIQTTTFARGMPAEQRDTIHGLFDSHDKFQREVTQTEDGYISKTTSDDPAAVELIQTHVKQMEGRLKSGMMVRSWDPAYVEFVNHYDDIDIQITDIDNGISIVATGKTEEAREVARNHAGIISKFIDYGWNEHDKTHAAVFETESATKGMGKMGGMSCCQPGGEETAQAGRACRTEGEGDCMVGGDSTDQKGRGMSCCQRS